MASVLAYVNHGRWLADCPDCGGGILTTTRAGEFLFGVSCRDCGAALDVVWPDARACVEAEDVLSRRRPEHRNWLPDREAVADLKAENARHGVSFAAGRR